MSDRFSAESVGGSTAFGITLEAFPLKLARFDGAPLGTLRWSTRRRTVGGPAHGWTLESGDGANVGWGGYADYAFRAGDPARVDVTTQVSDIEAARGFVLSVLPLVLPFFGLEPLHGGAAYSSGRTLLVLGATGSGKSSTVACLEELGWAFVADDACAIDGDNRVWPGAPFMNPRIGTVKQRVVGAYNGKALRHPDRVETGPRRISHVAILDPHSGRSGMSIRPAAASEAFTGILRHVRAPWFLVGRRSSVQMGMTAALAESASTATVSFDSRTSDFRSVADLISDWVL